MIVLTNKQKQMAEKLVECAKTHKHITYAELGAPVGVGPRQVGSQIGMISKKCRELDLPLISVLVISSSTHKPSYGFITEFFPEVIAEEEKDRIIEQTTQDVFNQKDWSSLLNWSYYENIYPDETTIICTNAEGRRKTIKMSYYERNPKLRRKCIEQKGTACKICGFDATTVYGKQFKGKIHIHHIIPLNQLGEHVTTVDELIPVCPNCHMILHSKGKNECYSVEEVKAMIEENKKM